ncbi:HAD hydrolase family protein [Desulfuromonas sp. TF]|uniref:HAD hydrolase family protein n=1 Tax=Desulfuromonas sp. TF TaxID=1232410 RepID=UPI0004125A9B|nr:HAD hydrolase family protein [Desulfuromonas sp. TF]
MRYLALVTDYDNTLAKDGRVTDSVVAKLRELRDSGRRVLLVTGRRIDDLLTVCGCIDCFDYVVAENGAVLYEPKTRESILLAEPPPEHFIVALQNRGVCPLEVGKVIVATHVPHVETVMETIQKFGLELQVIFNRGAVMVLPSGVNKASGVKYALRLLGMSPHEVVGVGDAENDHSFLRLSECAVAVANAIDSIKAIAAFVTDGETGEGISELIDELITNDLEPIDTKLAHHHIALGTRLDGTMVWLPPYGRNILVAGPSGSGKTTLSSGFIERLAEQFYQVCILDPEGDYTSLQNVVTIGDQRHAPSVEEVLAILRDPDVHVNVNLLGVKLSDRPHYFAELLPNLQAMRIHTGRPHWIVVDEAHHLLPSTWGHAARGLPQRLGETMLITMNPAHLAPLTLALVDVVLAVGPSANVTLKLFTEALKKPPVEIDSLLSGEGDVVCWFVQGGQDPFPMQVIRGQAERIRHHRKYAEGDVRYNSFYFRGPYGKQNLKAQNLFIFSQLAEGVDEETWLYHLQRGDYSRWFREVIKDESLAGEARITEMRKDLSSWDSRRLICEAIDKRYTLPE